MGKHTLEFHDPTAILLWSMVEEEQRRTLDELQRRHLLRKDGERNETKRYLSEYERGLIEDYNRLKTLSVKLNRIVDATEVRK